MSRPMSGCPASTMQAMLPSRLAVATSADIRSTSCMMSGPGGSAPHGAAPPPRAGAGGSPFAARAAAVAAANFAQEIRRQLHVLVEQRGAARQLLGRVVLAGSF